MPQGREINRPSQRSGLLSPPPVETLPRRACHSPMKGPTLPASSHFWAHGPLSPRNQERQHRVGGPRDSASRGPTPPSSPRVETRTCETPVAVTPGGPPLGARASASRGPAEAWAAPRRSSGLWPWTQQSRRQCLQLSNGSLFVLWPHSLWGLSSLTRDRTCTTTLGAWSPNHWATREAPSNSFLRTCEEPVPPTHHCLTLQPTVEEARLCQGGKRGSEGLKELSQRRGSNTSVHSPRSRQRPPTHGSWVGWGRWSGALRTAGATHAHGVSHTLTIRSSTRVTLTSTRGVTGEPSSPCKPVRGCGLGDPPDRCSAHRPLSTSGAPRSGQAPCRGAEGHGLRRCSPGGACRVTH